MEDTILQKLRRYKKSDIEKHFVDAAFVYHIQKKNLEQKYLKIWIKDLGLEKYYQEMTKLDPEKHI